MAHIQAILIGERIETMRKLAQGMERMGVSTRIVGSVDSTVRDFSVTEIDAVVLGRYLGKKKCETIEQHWRMHKPGVAIVHVQVPIGELTGEAIKAAIFKTGGQEMIVGSLSAHLRAISFSTLATSNIEVVLYHFTLLFRTRIKQIYAEADVLSGQQIVHIPRKTFGFGGEHFAVVTINSTEKHVVFLR